MRSILRTLKIVLVALTLFIINPICFESAQAKVDIVESCDDADNQKFELYFHSRKDVSDFKASLRELDAIFLGYDKKFKGVEQINMFELSLKELKKPFMDCLCKNVNKHSHSLLDRLCKVFAGIILGKFIVNEHSGMMIVNYYKLHKAFLDLIKTPFETSLADYEVLSIDIYVDLENRRLVFTY